MNNPKAHMSDIGYARLASAIIQSASEEYRHGILAQLKYEWAKNNCMKILRKKNGKRLVKKIIHEHDRAKYEIKSNEKFFESDWCRLLLTLVGLDQLDDVRIKEELHKRAIEDMVKWVKELEAKDDCRCD